MSMDIFREYYEQQEQEREFFAYSNYYNELAEQSRKELEREAIEREYYELEYQCMNLREPIHVGVCDCRPRPELTSDEIPF